MISKKLVAALNDQIQMEANASFLYLSMSGWCEVQGLKGCAAFLRRQSAEENMHMLKLVDYLLEISEVPVIPAVNKPKETFSSVASLLKEVYAHEQEVTKAIFRLVELSNKEDDFTTFNFLQWYVAEQREEEALMRDILDKINLIGDGPLSLYYIDQEVEKINQTIQGAAEA